MSPRVLGVDLSLTGTGLATEDGVRHVSSSAIDDPDPRRRWLRLSRIVGNVLEDTWNVDLVAVESPSLGQGRQVGTLDRMGLFWLLLDRLLVAGILVVEVPPSSLKKYATGDGSASKPDMRMALFRRAGIDLRNDNEVDAWWLRAVGLALLDAPVVELPADHRKALDKLKLPIGAG